MFSAIHSLKFPQKQRSRSQNVTQRDQQQQQSMLKTFIKRRTTTIKQIQQPYLKKPKNNNINMLLNGKTIEQITINSRKGQTVQNSPKNAFNTTINHNNTDKNNNSNIKEYIYRKYLTQHEQKLSPHAQGIYRLRQMFNQRINKGKSTCENRQPQTENEVKWPKLQIYKVNTSLTDPDLNNITYISRARKYQQMQQPLRDRYLRIFRQRQQGKRNSIHVNLHMQSVQDQCPSETIDPWETD